MTTTSHVRLATAVSLVLATTGCDPVYGLNATVRVAPAVQSWVSSYPVQVLLVARKVPADASAQPNDPGPWLLGVLCQASSDPFVVEADFGGVGCAIETDLTAYLAAADASLPCGPRSPKERAYDAPAPSAALLAATARAFAGTTSPSCGGKSAAITIDLDQVPAAP